MSQSKDTTTLEYVKEHCPAFQQGRYCPYNNIPCFKGLAKGCPEFKNGCPFKDIKTIGEFKAKLGQMRDECKGKQNYKQALEFFHGATGAETLTFGRGCPFFADGCLLATDEKKKPILADHFSLQYVKAHCPAFQKGKACPYNVPDFKGLAKGCPAFKNGCPFKDVKTVGDLEAKLGEMRDLCKGYHNYHKALMIIHSAGGKAVATLGHCPFFKFGCPLTTDREAKAIIPDTVRLDYVNSHCPVFQKGCACPYNIKELEGVAGECPEFKKAGCPFKSAKSIGEFKAKLGEMRDNCKGKENYEQALDLIHATTGQKVFQYGHCPFFKGGCLMKTDINDKPVVPGSKIGP